PHTGKEGGVGVVSVDAAIEGINSINRWLQSEQETMLTQFYGDHTNTTLFAGVGTAVGFAPMPYGAILGFAVSQVSGMVTTEGQNAAVDEAIERTDFLGAQSRGQQAGLVRQIFSENNSIIESLGYHHGAVAAMFDGERSQVDHEIEDLDGAIAALRDQRASTVDLTNAKTQLCQAQELLQTYEDRKSQFTSTVGMIPSIVGRVAMAAHSAQGRLKQRYMQWLLQGGELKMRFTARRRHPAPHYTFTQHITGLGNSGNSLSPQMNTWVTGKNWNQLRELQIPLWLYGDFYSAPNKLTFTQSSSGEREVSPRGMIRYILSRSYGSYEAGIEKFWNALSRTPIGQTCTLT
ncbi:MAG: hypothetical protein AAFS10_11855, partial [Myxococcota bacterium]